MDFLVVSQISIPAKDRTLPAWEYLRSLGHRVWVEHPRGRAVIGKPDIIISMGVTVMEETFLAINKFPDALLMCYNWDVYEFIWEPGHEGKVQAKHASRPNEYNYVRYGELLRQADEIWVPSICTGERTTQWYGLENWHVILSACPWWDYDDIQDDGYALCTLRHLPDPWDTKFEEACAQVGVPYMRTDHDLSWEGYQRAVAHCRFLVSHYYEASTGGLTLMEGYYHGKPVLLSNSHWCGGSDYLGPLAKYFEWGNVDDFKEKLLSMHSHPPVLDRGECQQWIKTRFSDQRMIDDMLERVYANTR